MSGTSGTYLFNPAIADFVIDAYERCGIQSTELTVQSMKLASAKRSANLVLSSWANKGINLWTVNEVVQTMTVGTIQYFADTTCVDVLADSVVVRTWPGGIPTPLPPSPPVSPASYYDIRMYAISRTDWQSLPQKAINEDRPTSYWLDRQIVPVFNIWPQANVANTYQLVYKQSRYVQDADMTGGQQLQVPQRFYMAFVSGLAADLAIKWAPERAVALATKAQQDWMEAADEDSEKVPFYIAPDLSSYML